MDMQNPSATVVRERTAIGVAEHERTEHAPFGNLS
jgi:hypothetical protein